jgi:hypothetical protein
VRAKATIFVGCRWGAADAGKTRVQGDQLVAFQPWSRSGILTIAKQPFQVTRHIGIAGFAADAANYFAVAVQDDGRGDHIAKVEAVERTDVGPGPNIQHDVLLLEEGLNLGKVFRVINRDGDEVHAPRSVLLAEDRETGKFFAAGCAPRRPEADYREGAVKIAEAMIAAGQVVKLEVRRWFCER